MEKSLESSYVYTLSNRLQKPIPREKILSVPYIDFEYNAELINELLNCIRIENSLIIVASNLLNGLDSLEKWSMSEYNYQPISEKLIKVNLCMYCCNSIIVFFNC